MEQIQYLLMVLLYKQIVKDLIINPISLVPQLRIFLKLISKYLKTFLPNHYFDDDKELWYIFQYQKNLYNSVITFPIKLLSLSDTIILGNPILEKIFINAYDIVFAFLLGIATASGYLVA